RVMALDLEVEAMRRATGGLDVPFEDAGLHGAKPPTPVEINRKLLQGWMPIEPATLARMELVVHRGVHVGSNQRVKPYCLFGREPDPAPIVARSTHPKALHGGHDAVTGLAGKSLVVEHRLALAPAGERAHERAIISVPDSQPSRIE